MLINLLNLWPVLRPIATCAPLSPHWPLLGSVVFFAPLRFVLRSLGVGLRLVSVVRAFSLASCAAGDFFGLLAPVPRLRDHTSHTPRPARPPEASSAGPPEATFFWGELR